MGLMKKHNSFNIASKKIFCLLFPIIFMYMQEKMSNEVLANLTFFKDYGYKIRK